MFERATQEIERIKIAVNELNKLVRYMEARVATATRDISNSGAPEDEAGDQDLEYDIMCCLYTSEEEIVSDLYYPT